MTRPVRTAAPRLESVSCRLPRDLWEEVVRMAAGLRPAQTATQLLELLVRQGIDAAAGTLPVVLPPPAEEE